MHLLREKPEKVPDAHGRLQNVAGLEAHGSNGFIDCLDNRGAGVVGVEGGGAGGGVFLRGKCGVQLCKFVCPIWLIFIERICQTSPAHITGEDFLLFRAGLQALKFQLLQKIDCRHIRPELGLCAACAEIIVQNAEILRRRQRCGRVNLRLVKTQGANLHIIGEVVFVSGIHRHGFLGISGFWFFFGDSRILCGGLFRLRIPLHEPCEALPALRTGNGIAKRRIAERNIKKTNALNNKRLAVLQIYRIAYGIRERFSLRGRSRFFRFMPAVLLHILIRNVNEVAEIKIFQLVGNKLLQRAVLPGFQMLVIQIALQPVIHKVDIHLNGNLIVGDGGVSDANLGGVAEIRL